jgi:hypothetical protein
MAEKALVILAAGIGSRYGGLKQMDPVGPSGEFIIDYSAFDAARAGFNRIVFLINRAIEADFKAGVGARIARRLAVDYAFQELGDLPAGFAPPAGRRKPWGTGHALLCAAESVRGPFAVVNADDFYGRASFAVLSRFLDESAGDAALHAMVGFRLGATISDCGSVARGVCLVRPDGMLETVVERTGIERANGGARCPDGRGGWLALTGAEPVSMNMWGFKPSVFAALRGEFNAFLERSGGDARAEFFIPDVVNGLVRGGAARVAVLRTASEWFGVTYAQERPRVVRRLRALVDAGEYPAALWD